MISIQVYFIHCCFNFCLISFNFQLISWEVTFYSCDRSHLLGRSFAETFSKASNLLRKRTITPLGAIVRSLAMRLKAYVCLHPTPIPKNECERSHLLGRSNTLGKECHLSPVPPSLLQQCVAIDCSWLEYQFFFFFSGHVFLDTSLGV
jgi:hypothetical protein